MLLKRTVVKNLTANAEHTKDTGSIPGLRRSPGGGNVTNANQINYLNFLVTYKTPTPVFLPGEFHGQKSLAGYTVPGVTKSQTQWSAHTYMHTAGFCPVEDFSQDNT